MPKHKMVPVVYDSVGKETFSQSLGCLRPRGLLVSFGQSSGAIDPIDPAILAQKGSLYLTRPTIRTYADRRADLLAMSRNLFEVVLSGAVDIRIRQTYTLRDAAEAHRDLQRRRTVGSTVLIV